MSCCFAIFLSRSRRHFARALASAVAPPESAGLRPLFGESCSGVRLTMIRPCSLIIRLGSREPLPPFGGCSAPGNAGRRSLVRRAGVSSALVGSSTGALPGTIGELQGSRSQTTSTTLGFRTTNPRSRVTESWFTRPSELGTIVPQNG